MPVFRPNFLNSFVFSMIPNNMARANPLKISLVQIDLVWENKTENLSNIAKLILNDQSVSDIYLLPEMFTSGFSMNPSNLSETPDGESFQWMKQIAKKKNALIAGSLIIAENGQYYNRFYAMQPDGKSISYDKRHLFRMGDEETHYSHGSSRVVFEWKGWRFLPVICYDIRFPVWMRNQDDYDVILVVANWPEPRREVWRNLLIARSLENQSYVAAVNRTGKDANGINYVGDSLLIDPKGCLITDGADQPGLIKGELNYKELIGFREKFPAFLDRDNFTIHS